MVLSPWKIWFSFQAAINYIFKRQLMRGFVIVVYLLSTVLFMQDIIFHYLQFCTHVLVFFFFLSIAIKLSSFNHLFWQPVSFKFMLPFMFTFILAADRIWSSGINTVSLIENTIFWVSFSLLNFSLCKCLASDLKLVNEERMGWNPFWSSLTLLSKSPWILW